MTVIYKFLIYESSMATESLLSYMPSRLTCLGAFAPYLPWYLRALNTCLVSLISTPLIMIKSLTKAILKCSKRGHSKSTFAQESRVFTPPPSSPPAPLFVLVRFWAPHTSQGTFVLARIHPLPHKVSTLWRCPLYRESI